MNKINKRIMSVKMGFKKSFMKVSMHCHTPSRAIIINVRRVVETYGITTHYNNNHIVTQLKF